MGPKTSGLLGNSPCLGLIYMESPCFPWKGLEKRCNHLSLVWEVLVGKLASPGDSMEAPQPEEKLGAIPGMVLRGCEVQQGTTSKVVLFVVQPSRKPILKSGRWTSESQHKMSKPGMCPWSKLRFYGVWPCFP